MRIKKRDFFLWVVLLIPYLCLIPAGYWYLNKLDYIENSSFIIINKADFSLTHYNYKGELLQKSTIALGENPGNKKDIGDMKTPEGIFQIVDIQDASDWVHDFKGDALGEIQGAFGPYFVRLNVPGQKGIGIHGTPYDNSIGTRASEGCIRMYNTDITKLVKSIKTASIVVIVPGIEDQNVNYQISKEDNRQSKSISNKHKELDKNLKVMKKTDKKIDSKRRAFK